MTATNCRIVSQFLLESESDTKVKLLATESEIMIITYLSLDKVQESYSSRTAELHVHSPVFRIRKLA